MAFGAWEKLKVMKTSVDIVAGDRLLHYVE
jgi:hypothetical protein